MTDTSTQNPPMTIVNHIIDLYSIVKSGKKVFFAAAIAVYCSFIVVAAAIPSAYTSFAQLLLDSKTDSLTKTQSNAVDVILDDSAVATQIEIIRSFEVVAAAVKKLDLTNDSEFVQHSNAENRPFIAKFQSYLGGAFGAHIASGKIEPELLFNATILSVQSRLLVRRIGRTYVIEVGFKSKDPIKSRRIANAIAQAYIDVSINAKYDASRLATDWLQDRSARLGSEAIEADKKLQAYKAKIGIVNFGGENADEQQLKEINSELVKAKASVDAAYARFQSFSANQGNESATAGADGGLSAPSSLRRQILESSRRITDLQQRLGPQHSAVVAAKKDLQELQELDRKSVRDRLNSLRNDYEVSISRENELKRAFNQLVEKSENAKRTGEQLQTLESNARALRTLRDVFLNKSVEVAQQQSIPSTDARIVSPASQSQRSEPTPRLVLEIGAFFAFFSGIMASVFYSKLDRGVISSEQVEEVFKLPCAGLLPFRVVDPKTTDQGSRIDRLVSTDPYSRFSEVVRNIRFLFKSNNSGRSSQVIGVISALPGEGKTTIASNLALVCREGGRSVLVVDLDFRKRSISESLSNEAGPDLIDVLKDIGKFDAAIQTDVVSGVSIIPTSKKHAATNFSDVIYSGRMHTFFDTARTKFDYIIVDFAPMLAVGDSKAAIPLIDSFVLVIKWSDVAVRIIKRAINSSRPIEDKVCAVVVNQVSENFIRSFESKYGHMIDSYYNGFPST